MGALVAHPHAPDAQNLVGRTDGYARETQNSLAVVGKHDTHAIPLE